MTDSSIAQRRKWCGALGHDMCPVIATREQEKDFIPLSLTSSTICCRRCGLVIRVGGTVLDWFQTNGVPHDQAG